MAEQSLVKEIACGAAHSCVTGVKKGMWTWGSNDYSQLGHSDGERRVADPTAVPDMAERNVKFIAAGYVLYICLILTKGLFLLGLQLLSYNGMCAQPHTNR